MTLLWQPIQTDPGKMVGDMEIFYLFDWKCIEHVLSF